MKTCTACGESLPLTAFGKHPNGDRGRKSRCRTCLSNESVAFHQSRKSDPAYREKREAWRLKRWGLTPESFQQLLDSQAGRCAVCGSDNPGGRGGFHIDHDHGCCEGQKSCGKCIRGLLCARCNQGVGLLREDPFILESAIRYLGV